MLQMTCDQFFEFYKDPNIIVEKYVIHKLKILYALANKFYFNLWLHKWNVIYTIFFISFTPSLLGFSSKKFVQLFKMGRFTKHKTIVANISLA